MFSFVRVYKEGENFNRRNIFPGLNRHGRIQTCLCANTSACAPTHADRRRQAQELNKKRACKTPNIYTVS